MFWRPYVPVAERQRSARRRMEKLKKKGVVIQPVEIEGRTIARSFWGKGWCEHLESFSDYSNRLPRGRTYVRNGSVCHLEITPGRIEAMVSGSDMYTVSITIEKLKSPIWKAIQKQCAGQIGSMLELLQGKLSSQVMAIVTDRKNGLFPQPGEMKLNCSCPDWAVMCKHVAAVLYGVGSRLDSRPDLLFLLRDVDAQELISADLSIPDTQADLVENVLSDNDLSDIFGIDIENENPGSVASPVPVKRPKAARKAETTPKPKTPPQVPKTEKVKLSAPSKVPMAEPKRSVPEKNIRPSTTASRSRPEPLPVQRKRTSAARIKEKPVQVALPAKFSATGAFIARMRRAMNLSVSDFAVRVGVSLPTVQRWEAATEPLLLRSRTEKALLDLHRKLLKKESAKKK